MKDIKLNKNEPHDILVQDYDLSLVDSSSQIRQKITVKLRFILGEWFLNTIVGIPYYEQIWIKNPDLNKVSTVMKNEILNVNGVQSLTLFNMEYNTNRTIRVKFRVNTQLGEIEGEENI
jgi:hypothetical protein